MRARVPLRISGRVMVSVGVKVRGWWGDRVRVVNLKARGGVRMRMRAGQGEVDGGLAQGRVGV